MTEWFLHQIAITYCKVVIFLALEITVTDFAFWLKGNRLAYNVLSLDISNKLNNRTTSNDISDNKPGRGDNGGNV